MRRKKLTREDEARQSIARLKVNLRSALGRERTTIVDAIKRWEAALPAHEREYAI